MGGSTVATSSALGSRRGGDDLLVIVGGGKVQRGGRAGQIGLQAAIVEDRQMNRGPAADRAGIDIEKIPQPNRLEARERREIDVRVESAPRDLTPCRGGGDPILRGRQIGTAREQIGRDHRWQHQPVEAQCGRPDRGGVIGTAPGERRQRRDRPSSSTHALPPAVAYVPRREPATTVNVAAGPDAGEPDAANRGPGCRLRRGHPRARRRRAQRIRRGAPSGSSPRRRASGGSDRASAASTTRTPRGRA